VFRHLPELRRRVNDLAARLEELESRLKRQPSSRE
jgi:hypothetical protein